jgi:type IV pilus assembly protein PilM
MGDETSIWKKEIGFGRKPKTAAVETSAAPTPAAQPSIWKKEISFRRRRDRAADYVLVPPTQAASVAPAASEPPQDLPSLPAEQVLPPVAPPVPPPAAPPAAPPAEPMSPPTGQPPRLQPDAPVDAPVAPPFTTPAPAPGAPAASHAAGTASAPPPSHEPHDVDGGAYGPSSAAEPIVSRAAASPPTGPSEPVLPAAPQPAPAVERPAAQPAPPVAALPVDALPESPLPPASAAPVSAPAEPELSRRERRAAKHAAELAATENRKREKERAKESGASPSQHARVVGLKVGASQIAAAEVINKAGPRIVRMARMPLDRGVVVGGELREPDKLAAALKTFFRKNKLPRSCVRLGVSNNRIGVRTFEIAGIDDEKQLANAIRFRAQEALPIPLSEAVLDYRILDERLDEDGVRIRRVLLVVAHRDLVERYAAACRKAGLKLIGIDLEAFALLRALADPAAPPPEDAAVVCITVGHDRSTLAVSDGRVCEFTRVLAWGGSSLDAALVRLLEVTPANAEKIRHDLSLADNGEAAGLDAQQADEARRTLSAELQVFAREIVASLRFYQEQPGSLGIYELLVTGGAAASGGLAAELERLIGIPVRVADPLVRVKLPKKLESVQSGAGSLAVAVGLGIED